MIEDEEEERRLGLSKDSRIKVTQLSRKPAESFVRVKTRDSILELGRKFATSSFREWLDDSISSSIIMKESKVTPTQIKLDSGEVSEFEKQSYGESKEWLGWMRERLEAHLELVASSSANFSLSSLARHLESSNLSSSIGNDIGKGAIERVEVTYEQSTSKNQQPLLLLVCGASNFGPKNRLILDSSNSIRVASRPKWNRERNSYFIDKLAPPIFRPIQLQVNGKFV